ncbi:MAG: hypothetical protein A3F40_03535 [Chlamydiae bacterium RIFCSPHIGHO2_12_FULL_27_8]|nr:MAG: hypothetical protein A3F40_03535 [Chlamydiae bacterium RIFCSPHIGHO2_12_FULL_27_8]
MSSIKYLIIAAILLFAFIGIAGTMKNKKNNKEIVFDSKKNKVQEVKIVEKIPEKKIEKQKTVALKKTEEIKKEVIDDNLPDNNIIDRFFALDSSKLPIVETITYSSRVPWLKGRPAWIADYSSYYSTTRHFIARSLNRKADYFTQNVTPGDRFNVLKKDKNLKFHLIIDLSRSKMWFYYNDLDTNEKVLLKTYNVGLGRKDSKRLSGYLTPIGEYELGSKVAIYKNDTMGYFQDSKIQMIKIFGTRWIPFDKEIANCTESPKGLGIHGAPWLEVNNQFVEDREKVGKYESDGCVRLLSEDMEELFSIIISRNTTVELVKDFKDNKFIKEKK